MRPGVGTVACDVAGVAGRRVLTPAAGPGFDAEMALAPVAAGVPCGHAGAAIVRTSTAAIARVKCGVRAAGVPGWTTGALNRSGRRRGHGFLGILL
ncbi:hypothetical protein GCM10009080_26280 [Cupriavidus pauculus]